MKITKSYLKHLIKESLEEMSMSKELPLVHRVDSGMIEAALSGQDDFLVNQQFAAEIVKKHNIGFGEAMTELGEKPVYKVSELFGWLGY